MQFVALWLLALDCLTRLCAGYRVSDYGVAKTYPYVGLRSINIQVAIAQKNENLASAMRRIETLGSAEATQIVMIGIGDGADADALLMVGLLATSPNVRLYSASGRAVNIAVKEMGDAKNQFAHHVSLFRLPQATELSPGSLQRMHAQIMANESLAQPNDQCLDASRRDALDAVFFVIYDQDAIQSSFDEFEYYSPDTSNSQFVVGSLPHVMEYLLSGTLLHSTEWTPGNHLEPIEEGDTDLDERRFSDY